MSRRIILVGDGGSHAGARVISGSPNRSVNGRAIARRGDQIDCPQKCPDGTPHGVNPIVEGTEQYLVDGVPAALDGHHTACGCTLVGSVNTFVG